MTNDFVERRARQIPEEIREIAARWMQDFRTIPVGVRIRRPYDPILLRDPTFPISENQELIAYLQAVADHHYPDWEICVDEYIGAPPQIMVLRYDPPRRPEEYFHYRGSELPE